MSNTVVNTRTYSSSLTKGLRLLSLFTRERPEWGVSELSVVLGTAKSTVSRIARTLEAEGFLERAENSERLRLGIKLWSLGSQVIGHKSDFPHRARTPPYPGGMRPRPMLPRPCAPRSRCCNAAASRPRC